MVVVSGQTDLAARIQDAELGNVVKLILMKPVDTAFLVRYVHGDRFCIRDTPPNAPPVRARTDVPSEIPAAIEPWAARSKP